MAGHILSWVDCWTRRSERPTRQIEKDVSLAKENTAGHKDEGGQYVLTNEIIIFGFIIRQ